MAGFQHVYRSLQEPITASLKFSHVSFLSLASFWPVFSLWR